MIRLNERLGDLGTFATILPEPELIPVAAVAASVRKVIDARGRMRELRRVRDAAQADLFAAQGVMEDAAAEAMIADGKVPKDIRKGVRRAEEAYELAKIEADAAHRAFAHVFEAMKATIEANRDALEAAAVKQAEAAVQKLAGAKRTVDLAAVEAEAALGCLGMFSESDRAGIFIATYREPAHSRSFTTVATAVTALGEALGHTNLALEQSKRLREAPAVESPTPKATAASNAADNAAEVQARRAERRSETAGRSDG